MKATDGHGVRRARLILPILAIVAPTTACLASLPAENTVYKYYSVDINFFSIDQTAPIDSYKRYGAGNAGDGGMVSLGCHDDLRKFRVEVTGINREGRFVAKVSIIPEKNDPHTKENSFEVDLTGLKPRGFELTKSDDGRVYMLNLTPGIAVVDNRPKRADDTAFRFSRWSLHNSLVILNDRVYAGQMGCSGGPLAYISYPGFAKVEFSLEPFRGAKRLGTLKDGRIQIRSEDGQSLDIYGVKNGVHRLQLPGGPYEVWVRWQNLPEEAESKIPAKEEWIRRVKARFAQMGSTPPTDDELDKGYERAKHERYLPLSCGVGPIARSDRIGE